MGASGRSHLVIDNDPARMSDVPDVRVPIQDGSRSIGEFIFLAIFGLPSLAVLLLAIPLAVARNWLGAALALGAGGFFTGAFSQALPMLWRGRPSDLVIEADGIRIAGGLAAGRSLRLDEVDTDASGFRPFFEGIDLGVIEIRTKTDTIVIADGVAFDEAAAVLEVIRAAQRLPERPREAWMLPARSQAAAEDGKQTRSRKKAEKRARAAAEKKAASSASKQEAAAPASDALDVLFCRGCGAPLVPVDGDEAACRHCDARTPQPAALRERMAELSRAGALSRANDERLARIAAQPRARESAVALFGLLGATAVGFLAAHVMVSRTVILRDTDAVTQALRGGFFTLALSAIAATLASAYIARRAVIRAAALGFAAIPSERPGGAPQCHACGAPLPQGRGLLSRCGYCRSTNIVAMTVPRPTHGLERAHSSLEASLAEQAKNIDGTRKWVIGVVPIAILAAAWVGREIFDPSSERRYDRIALGECKNAKGCFAFGAAGNDPRYMRLACELGHAEGCMKIGAWTYMGNVGIERDEKKALVLFDRSCELGFHEACQVAAGLRERAK
jgi:hypothetical protein